MRYETFSYLYPPRPDSKQAIMPKMLGFYERQKYICQYKKNGTANVIAVAPDGTITAMNRHNDTHKLWEPTKASSAAFQNLPGQGWYVFVAELLHSKVTGGPKDTNYIFDILVADGEYLVGKTFEERQAILMGLFQDVQDGPASHWIINDNTWLAKPIKSGFRAIFDGLTELEDEGIVLKHPKAPLEMCSKETANSRWSVKCRKPHKNFGF